MGTHGMSPGEMRGAKVYSSDGQELGTVDDVIIDDEGSARFVSVKGGLEGMEKRTIPADGLETSKDGLQSMYTLSQVKGGPSWDDGELDDVRQRELGGYYGTDSSS